MKNRLKIFDFFQKLKSHFNSKEEILSCFSKYQFQSEGWFKGECIALLDSMKLKGEILDFDREVKVDRKQIDLAIDLEEGRHWAELKQWFIGTQKGYTWNTKSQITALENEFSKFETIQVEKNGWLLVLCVPNPGKSDWSDGIEYFNKEYKPWELEPLEDPDDYPHSHFLGIIHVKRLKI